MSTEYLTFGMNYFSICIVTVLSQSQFRQNVQREFVLSHTRVSCLLINNLKKNQLDGNLQNTESCVHDGVADVKITE